MLTDASAAASESSAAAVMLRRCLLPGAVAQARELDAGLDEARIERRRPRGPRLELRVRLRAQEPRVRRQLDHLDEVGRHEFSREDHAFALEDVAVLVVEFEAVAMPFG